MMMNLVRQSLYVWLVQVVMRKMKEEQGEGGQPEVFWSFKRPPNDGESC
jgi:hypothetical protein